MKPGYLLLDVDGCLAPFSELSGYTYDDNTGVYYSESNAKWLNQMRDRITLVWATAWEHEANEVISPLHDLHHLPTIEFDNGLQRVLCSDGWMDWKLPSIINWVGGAPFCWIDDEISKEAFFWAEVRNKYHPTLFVQTDPLYGFRPEHMTQIEEWVDSL